jgi:hypothetical protein
VYANTAKVRESGRLVKKTYFSGGFTMQKMSGSAVVTKRQDVAVADLWQGTLVRIVGHLAAARKSDVAVDDRAAKLRAAAEEIVAGDVGPALIQSVSSALSPPSPSQVPDDPEVSLRRSRAVARELALLAKAFFEQNARWSLLRRIDAAVSFLSQVLLVHDAGNGVLLSVFGLGEERTREIMRQHVLQRLSGDDALPELLYAAVRMEIFTTDNVNALLELNKKNPNFYRAYQNFVLYGDIGSKATAWDDDVLSAETREQIDIFVECLRVSSSLTQVNGGVDMKNATVRAQGVFGFDTTSRAARSEIFDDGVHFAIERVDSVPTDRALSDLR